MKLVLGIGAGLLVALGVGWLWGASGTPALHRSLQLAELEDSLLKGRMAVLDARLSIYSVNFGEASRHFEAARTALGDADRRLGALGRQADATLVAAAVAKIGEAQRKAGELNQDANALAADAAQTIDEVIGHAAPR